MLVTLLLEVNTKVIHPPEAVELLIGGGIVNPEKIPRSSAVLSGPS
jgi:hypothetical protein